MGERGRRGVNWSTDRVEVKGIKIHYYRSEGKAGAAPTGPPVVLAHGITDNGQCWNRLAGVLAEGYDVIAIDARGHGLSDRPERGYSARDHAGDLAGLVEVLGLKKPALIGHSMGADNVAMVAAMRPELAGCVVLEDPPWRSSVEKLTQQEQEDRAEQWREQIRFRQRHKLSEVMEQGRESHPNWDESEYGPWADAKLQVDVRVLDYIVEREPWSKIVRSIRCPVLMITGDPRAEAIVTQETAERICRINDRFEWVRIEGAGHSIRRERFEQYVEALKNFMSRHYPPG
jgi:pimeloyl-ACP methyl ester carboxylesterase